MMKIEKTISEHIPVQLREEGGFWSPGVVLFQTRSLIVFVPLFRKRLDGVCFVRKRIYPMFRPWTKKQISTIKNLGVLERYLQLFQKTEYSNLPSILNYFKDSRELISVWEKSTREPYWVGQVVASGNKLVQLRLINPRGDWVGQDVRVRLIDIIQVVACSSYEKRLGRKSNKSLQGIGTCAPNPET